MTQPTRKPVVDQIFGDNKAPILPVLKADFEDLAAEVARAVAAMDAVNVAPKTDEDQASIGKAIMDGRALWKRADEARATEKAPILEAGRDLDAFFKELLAPLVKAGESLQKTADDYARRKAAEERARAQREAEEARRKAEEERQKAEAARTAAGAARAEGRAEVLEQRAERAEADAAASDADLVRSRAGGITTSAKGAWVATITSYQDAIAPLGVLGNFLKRDAIEAALNSMAKVQKEGSAWPGVTFAQDTKATFRR